MATTHTLRKTLLDTIKDLKSGKISPKEANAVSKAASQIVYTTRLELENKRMELRHSRSVPSNCKTTSVPNIEL